jgi:hypothetical protein
MKASRRTWCGFHTNSDIEKQFENKTAKAIVVNGNRIDSDLV